VRTSRAGESALLLLDVVEVLSTAGIAYAVIGALAASIHGAVRASLDADAVLSASPREAHQLHELLEAAGFRVTGRRGDSDDPIAALLQVTDAFDNRVDLLLGLRGLEAAAFARAVDVPFQGIRLRFVCREDFIAMKAFAGGPVDRLDASAALVAAGNQLDEPLLRRIAAAYGRDAARLVDSLLVESGRR
jgi:hypothetical protein